MPRKGSKRRSSQLAFARRTKAAKTNETADCDSSKSAATSASRRKLEMMAGQEIDAVEEQNWMLCHAFQLTRLIGDLLCPICTEPGLLVTICQNQNMGFASKLRLQCSVCWYETHQFSSPRIGDSDKKNVAFEINPKMVMFSHEVGKSHTVLQTFGSVIGMPAMHLTTFQDHDKKLTAAEVEAGEELLQRSAEAIRQAYADTDPDLQEAVDGGLPHPCINISVSFDGTWQKRGFTSLYGVGVCIDVLTGLVIDYHVLSKYCHACVVNTKRLPPAELAAWKANHAPDCCINHHKCSKAMEQEAAKVMWGRSVTKYGLRYVEMLSDGDSSAHKAVCDMKPYGEDIAITKLDCVNHAHKRMGTALRKLAKEQRLGGRGVGRLTDAKCKSLQNFYRGAVLDNIPNIDQMRSAVWSGLYHSMSTDQEPHHRQCPRGEDSQCFYQKALALGEDPPSHTDHPSSTYLSTTVAHQLIPIYRRMSDESLLRRMIHGGTQNTNECLNATIWVRCPKTSFMGMQRLQGSVARAVSAFNEGATEMISIMNKLYVDISNITLELLTKKDQRRMCHSDAVQSAEVRERRKEYAARRRRIALEEERRDGHAYGAGDH